HFVKNLDRITEDLDTFHDRRNRFLDHVMSRFAEQFSDYALLMYHINKKKAPTELIDDKIAFLSDYPIISSERGKAFNYKNEAEIWNTNNVAGLKKRLSRLLGIDSYSRKHLYCQPVDDCFEVFKDIAGQWRFHLKNNEGKVVLKSEGYTTKQMCKKGINSVKLHGQELKFYFPKTSVDGRFFFNIKSNNGEIVATSILYNSKTLRDRAIQQLISIFKGECNVEGFHLVEHLLLRPQTENDKLMEVCVDVDCDSCPGNIDPYSFRITLIVPYWPARFDNMAFRRFFEKTVRLETPAHIHAKICWADEKDIIAFEDAYKTWLEENAKHIPNPTALSLKLKKLIAVMNEIRSVYPVTTLHDCLDGGEENAVVLNNSILGTFNPEKNGND
ncbi:MAG TPA: YegP family protein, partial [Bacteroidales bacterium]